MPNDYLLQVLDEHLAYLDYLETRIKHLDEQIEQIATFPLYALAVKKLAAMKGIKSLTAMLLILEITDFRSFPNPRALMAFLGLIPSENSSGDKRKDGAITRAGNKRCKSALIESAQHNARSAHMSAQMKADLGYDATPAGYRIIYLCHLVKHCV